MAAWLDSSKRVLILPIFWEELIKCLKERKRRKKKRKRSSQKRLVKAIRIFLKGGPSAVPSPTSSFQEGVFLTGKTFVLRLGDGSDIIGGVARLAEEKEIEYGLLVSGCGRIREFELVLHEPGGSMNKMKFEGEFELNAISGKIRREKSGKIDMNLKVLVASTGFTPKAGQLVSGKVAGMLEIGVRKVGFEGIIEA